MGKYATDEAIGMQRGNFKKLVTATRVGGRVAKGERVPGEPSLKMARI